MNLKNEEVIFYIDKSISIEKWEKRNERNFNSVEGVSALEEVNAVLSYMDNLDSVYIAAY